jgi:hypothetical protein
LLQWGILEDGTDYQPQKLIEARNFNLPHQPTLRQTSVELTLRYALLLEQQHIQQKRQSSPSYAAAFKSYLLLQVLRFLIQIRLFTDYHRIVVLTNFSINLSKIFLTTLLIAF